MKINAGQSPRCKRYLRAGTSFFRDLGTFLAFFLLIYSSGAAEKPILHIGSELDFRPYAFVDNNGQPAGFSVELIQAVADKMGFHAQITTGPWDEIWNGLLKGKFDVLPTVAATPGREPLVDFTVSHTQTFDAFFRRSGQPAWPDLAAAAGKEIVVLRSDAAHHQLEERQFKGKVILIDSIPEGLRLIAQGKHDAFLCSKVIGVLELAQARIEGVEAGPPIPDYTRVFSFAVQKGNRELVEKLNQGLLIIQKNGDYDRIYRKWFAAHDTWRRWVPYFQWAVAGLVVLVIVVGVLQILVHRRTRQLARANEEIQAEVAQRRLAQEQLQQLNATLEQRVADRTEALRRAKDELAVMNEELEHKVRERTAKLQELVADLEHFSYTLTHDMRAPLRSMAQFIQLAMMGGCGNCPSAESKDFLKRVEKSAQRMDNLITDALQYTKAVRGELTLGPMDIARLLQGIIQSYPNLQPPHAEVRIEGEFPLVLGNQAALTQCFSNLLGNAVKFVAPGVHPKVRVWSETTGGWVRLWVEDNGIGIREEYQARIFDMFYRGSHAHEGTGIGLALVRKNVTKMGGAVGVKSLAGQGSRFWLDLKSAEPEPCS